MKADGQTPSPAGRGGFPLRLVWLLPAPVTALVVFGTRVGYWWLPASAMAVMSVTTYVLFTIDKRRAQSGAWRIPESTLHLCELFGGWPGAVLAQHYARHKSAKLSYRCVLWLIIAAHNYVAIDWLLGWRGAAWVAVMV